jgi:hypothetical protein
MVGTDRVIRNQMNEIKMAAPFTIAKEKRFAAVLKK